VERADSSPGADSLAVDQRRSAVSASRFRIGFGEVALFCRISLESIWNWPIGDHSFDRSGSLTSDRVPADVTVIIGRSSAMLMEITLLIDKWNFSSRGILRSLARMQSSIARAHPSYGSGSICIICTLTYELTNSAPKIFITLPGFYFNCGRRIICISCRYRSA